MEYQFPSDQELLQSEAKQFAEHFSITSSGKRKYHTLLKGEEAYCLLQVIELKRYEQMQGGKDEEWVRLYADSFAKFWKKTHIFISSLRQ